MELSLFEWIVLSGLFLAISAAGARLLLRWLPDPQLRQRLGSLAPETPPAADAPSAAAPLMQLMQVLRHLVEPADGQGVAARLAQAGWRSESALTCFYGCQGALLLLLPLIAWWQLPADISALNAMSIVLFAAIVGLSLPKWLLRRFVTQRRQRLQNALPDALELLRVCVEAGLGFDAALARVTRELSADCRDVRAEFGILLLEIEAGVARGQALRRMAQRSGLDDMSSLVTMLIQAERFGTPVGEALKVYAREMRIKRQLRAEEQANKTAVKLLLPMGLFIFPALLAVLLAPAMLTVARTLLPALSGGD